MNLPALFDDRLQIALTPTPRGVDGLVEQLLEACRGRDVEFERVGDTCVCRWSEGLEPREVPVPIPAAAYRTLLARVAALCNKRNPGSVSPYGGEGELSVGDETTVVRVTFVNTPRTQILKVNGFFDPSTDNR